MEALGPVDSLWEFGAQDARLFERHRRAVTHRVLRIVSHRERKEHKGK